MSKRKYEDRWQPRSSPQDHMIDLGGDDDRFCLVSHSGAHKLFAELLCRDLEAAGIRPAFFDCQSDYCPAKGEASGAASLEVAAKCGLGILLLSEEFFTASKWPMMQLAKMKEYRRRIRTSFTAPAKILPVYYRLNISEFMHYKRQDAWIQNWETMARGDRRINLDAWKAALADIVKHPRINIRLAQKTIDDDEGRRIIVNRVTDPTNGFVEPGFIRRDIAAPRASIPSLPPGKFVHPTAPRLSPAAASCAAPILQSKAECSHGVKMITSPTTSTDVEESDNEEGNEGSEKNENDEDSPGRETTPSDSEDAGEDEEDMSENEEDKEDDDYDVLEDDDGNDNNTDESSSDGDNSG